MITGLKIALAIILHLLVFCAIGTPLCIWSKKGSYSLTLSLILGYFIYFAIFGCIGVACIFLRVSTTGLAKLVTVYTLILSVFGLLTGRRMMRGWRESIPGKLKDHGPMLLLLLAVVLVQCLFQAFYTDGSQDAAFYVSLSSVAVEKNALALYNVYSGAKSTAFNPRYVFSAYPYHNAAWSLIMNLPPIIQARTVMPVVHAFVANLIYYRIGRELFRDRSAKAADLFVSFILLLQISSRTLYLPGAFYVARLYEGKSVIANIIVPAILLCMLFLYRRDAGEGRWPWLWLFFVNTAAVCFSGSVFIAALSQAGFALPVLVRDRKLKSWIGFAGSYLPVIIWGAAYTLSVKGYISLSIK